MNSQESSPQYRKTNEISHEGGGKSYMDFVDQTRLVCDVYAGKQSVVNGGFQIALGFLCILINMTSLILEPQGWGIYSQGFWGGAMYIIAGVLGILAGKTNIRGVIIAFFVFCVWTACIISPGAAICSGIGAYMHNNYDLPIIPQDSYQVWRLVSQILLLVMSGIQIGFAIWGCVMCGKAVCSCFVWRTVPIGLSPPSNLENFASPMAAGHQVQGQGQRVYPEAGASRVVYANQRGALVYEGYPSFLSGISGASQIATGILLIIFNAILIVLKPDGLGLVCHGFWGGLSFILTGASGVVAANLKTRWAVIGYMTACSVSMLLDGAVFATAVAGLVMRLDDCSDYYDFYDPCYGHGDAIIAMHAVMMALAVFEAIFAIWGCALAAKVLCGCCISSVKNKIQFKPTNQRLVIEDKICPQPHNAGFSLQARSVAVANIYDSAIVECHAQGGVYAQPIPQLRIQL